MRARHGTFSRFSRSGHLPVHIGGYRSRGLVWFRPNGGCQFCPFLGPVSTFQPIRWLEFGNPGQTRSMAKRGQRLVGGRRVKCSGLTELRALPMTTPYLNRLAQALDGVSMNHCWPMQTISECFSSSLTKNDIKISSSVKITIFRLVMPSLHQEFSSCV
ncbi:hypothetical protein BJX64DRAFT_143104 [Aspergillus heterothallicus]